MESIIGDLETNLLTPLSLYIMKEVCARTVKFMLLVYPPNFNSSPFVYPSISKERFILGEFYKQKFFKGVLNKAGYGMKFFWS